MKKVLISLSGGMDSATLLHLVIREHQYENVRSIFFDYGSKHNNYEWAAAEQIAAYYKVPILLINICMIGNLLKSDLLLSGGEIPEGHYESSEMTRTIVPGRNMIFISMLMGIAWSNQEEIIYLGMHEGDRIIYPDCRIEFIEAANKVVKMSTENNVSLSAPFLDLKLNKIGILKKGIEWGVPYQLTRTCYKDQSTACGKCGACQERAEAFAFNNLQDPVNWKQINIQIKKISQVQSSWILEHIAYLLEIFLRIPIVHSTRQKSLRSMLMLIVCS